MCLGLQCAPRRALGRIGHMGKRIWHHVTVLFAVIANVFHYPHNRVELVDGRAPPMMLAPEAPHLAHIEGDGVQTAITTRVQAEVRPAAIMPFNNSMMFPQPQTVPEQPLSYVWGPPLALLATTGA